jgi:hypothetical protein
MSHFGCVYWNTPCFKVAEKFGQKFTLTTANAPTGGETVYTYDVPRRGLYTFTAHTSVNSNSPQLVELTPIVYWTDDSGVERPSSLNSIYLSESGATEVSKFFQAKEGSQIKFKFNWQGATIPNLNEIYYYLTITAV